MTERTVLRAGVARAVVMHAVVQHAGVIRGLVLLGLAAPFATACKREQREFRASPPAASAPLPAQSGLQPGPAVVTANDLRAGGSALIQTRDPYEGNAYAIARGEQLFTQFNCVGCHSHGGGGIGPALMDSVWIYGSDPANIFETIVEGRPNGMPSFRGKLSNDQVWQLVAYVRSLSGLGRKDARPGRRDAMETRSSEQNTQSGPPRVSGAAQP